MQLDALLEAIYASPDDDGPRAVLADHLIQQGDPRGTFIALQLSRARGGGWPSKQERRLLHRHARRWCGALGPLLSRRGMRFERGFLHTARVQGQLSTHSLPVVAGVVGRPEWRTVRTLALPRDIHDDERVHATALELLSHPVLDRLQALYNLSPSLARALQDHAPPAALQELGLSGPFGAEPLSLGTAGLAGVRRLLLGGRIYLHMLHWLWSAPLWPRLEAITVMSDFYDQPGREAGYLDVLASRGGPSLERITLVPYSASLLEPSGWGLCWTRDDRDRFARLEAIPGPASRTREAACAALLRTLDRFEPGTIASLRIVEGPGFKPTEAQLEAISDACGRLGIQHLEVAPAEAPQPMAPTPRQP